MISVEFLRVLSPLVSEVNLYVLASLSLLMDPLSIDMHSDQRSFFHQGNHAFFLNDAIKLPELQLRCAFVCLSNR